MEVTETTCEVTKETSYITITDLRAQYMCWVLVAISLVLVSIMYNRLIAGWWNTWWAKDSLYSHGILVPFISMFAIYANKENLSKIPVRPNFALGISTLAIVMGMSLVCRAAGVSSIEGFTLPLFLVAGVALLFGAPMTKALLFPLLFLLFMCPLPGSILNMVNVKIQIWSTIVATQILALMQFDAAREGVTILMPNITVEVGEPCSGFRTLISLFALSTFVAYLLEGPRWGRIGVVLSTIPLGLVVNSIRITLIALVGEFYGMKAMHSFHDYSGYIMLIVSFVVLIFIARLMGCRKLRPVQ
ncbi:MAG: exosortase/archaeosortase family protein [Armatimonadota bacterium]|nr:exosortase/archaeosortase family protein [Armatimonadota bacterium]